MAAIQKLDNSKRKFEETVRTVDGENTPLITEVLPPEMLEKVFSYLAPRDLKTVMLVCKTWNNTGGLPALWSWVKVKLNAQSEDNFLEIINLKRLQCARELEIDIAPPKLLRAVLQHPGLKKITAGYIEDWEVEPDLIAQVFAKMEEIKIYCRAVGSMTSIMIDTVLQRPNNIKKLYWTGRLRDGDPVLLANALNKIEVLEVYLNEEEANLLFKMMQGKTAIRSLSFIGPLRLSKLEPTNLVRALDKIEVLLLCPEEAEMSSNALPVAVNLFKAVAAGTNVNKLEFSLAYLGAHIDSRLLGRMVTQVKELHLFDTFDKKDKIKAIVKAIANSEAVPLKKLSLSEVNLKFVSSRWLARMATKVEELHLDTQYMGKEEARAILGAIAVGPEKLKQLREGIKKKMPFL